MTQVYYSQARSSTAHRYGRKDWTEEKNRSVYGGQYSRDGLGHNFEVRLGLGGDTELSGAGRLAQTIDHKFLDQDVDFFKTCPSTLEMITSYLFHEASALWGRLVLDLEVQEGRELACQIRDGRLSLKKTVRARGVRAVYDIEVVVSGEVDPQSGLLVNRKELQTKIEKLIQDNWADSVLSEAADLATSGAAQKWDQLSVGFLPQVLESIVLHDALDNKVLKDLRRQTHEAKSL